MVTLQKIKGDPERWTLIKLLFKAKFAVVTDNKLILDGLADMAMKNSENVHDYFGHLNKTNKIIMGSKRSYTLIPAKPVPDANGVLDPAEVDAYYEIRDEAIGEFYLLNFFCAGQPTDLKRVINLQELNNLDLYTTVKLATIESRSKEECKSRVYTVDEDPEDAVHTIAYCQQRDQPQQQHRSNPPFRGNNRGSSSGYNNRNNPYSWRNPAQQNNSQGNNSNQNKQVCIFCKIPNHRQEDCQKMIAANKPCQDTSGRLFWLRINAAANNQNQPQATPIQSFQDFQF
jgi:hypothetical protein